VFATGRCAIEALCCGAAVIACDASGLGGLVTSQNYERLRQLNFALRALTGRVSVEAIHTELRKYDPNDAAFVSDQARVGCSLESLLDRVQEIYALVIGSWSQDRAEAAAKASRRAFLDFLHATLPRKSTDTRWPWMVERDDLIRQRNHLDTELTEERSRRLSLEQQLNAAQQRAQQQLDELLAQRQRANSESYGKARMAAAEAAAQAAETRASVLEATLTTISTSALWRIANYIHRFIRARPNLHGMLRRVRKAL
jgi:hypothetical protein